MAKDSKNKTSQKESEGQTKAVAKKSKGELLPEWGRDFDRVSEAFDRMMEDFWRGPFPRLWQPFRKLGISGLPGLSSPVVDVFEDKDNVVVKAELPGLEKGDVEVNLTDSRLTIKGEKKKEENVKEEDYSYSERSYGSFTRILQLPCEVKADKVKASFKNGVLEVTMPKSEEAKKRSVAVKVE